MWDHLTPADIERVKQRLAVNREEMLSRHAEELKELDAQQDELEALDRLVIGFAEKYLASDTTSSVADAMSKRPTVLADLGHTPASEMQQHEAASGGLQIRQQISPNFGTPPRLRRFVGG